MKNEIEDKALKKAELALDHVLLSMPHLVGLVQQIYLHIEPRVPTVGVFESGRMVINPLWFNDLSLDAATFVMAHELMHLMLKTHQRQGTTDAQMVNIAHDIIINFLLERKLGMPTPADGLTYDKVLEYDQHYEFAYNDNISLEKVIGLLSKSSRFNNSVKSWSKDYIFTSGDQVTNSTNLGAALEKALNPSSNQQKQSAHNRD